VLDIDIDTAGETLRVLSVKNEGDSASLRCVRELVSGDVEYLSGGERLHFGGADIGTLTPRAALTL